jgi:PadR family transcriptional regulator AphA
MANAISIRQFILGLLARQPMSGYDIKRFFKSLSWLIDSPSFGSLYPALHALLEGGLVTVEIIPQQDKPPRKIYSITGTGEETLQEWMGQPAESGVSLKAFLMRLILVSNLSQDDLVAHLERRRTQVARHLRQTAEAMGNEADLGERLALDYGVAVANAELAWLNSALSRLS